MRYAARGSWGNKSQRATSQRYKNHRPRGQTEAPELPRVQICCRRLRGEHRAGPGEAGAVGSGKELACAISGPNQHVSGGGCQLPSLTSIAGDIVAGSPSPSFFTPPPPPPLSLHPPLEFGCFSPPEAPLVKRNGLALVLSSETPSCSDTVPRLFSKFFHRAVRAQGLACVSELSPPPACSGPTASVPPEGLLLPLAAPSLDCLIFISAQVFLQRFRLPCAAICRHLHMDGSRSRKAMSKFNAHSSLPNALPTPG